jgi:hypothetical protein
VLTNLYSIESTTTIIIMLPSLTAPHCINKALQLIKLEYTTHNTQKMGLARGYKPGWLDLPSQKANHRPHYFSGGHLNVGAFM